MRSLVLIVILFIILPRPLYAQYPPQAGISGSTAISGSSSQLVAWATNCTVSRGLRNIAWPDSGRVSAGTDAAGTGPSDGFVVSLGDSGTATLTFAHPITDGPGADFAVFENGFADPQNSAQAFLELAFVEVSSDGIHFARFPCSSHTQDTAQISSIIGSNYMDASLINNLAGKYIGGWGTPFDLAELSGTPNLDVNSIIQVRIVDCIGAINSNATLDASGRKVNDPYPTPFATGGFDLDAVGVIHQSSTGIGEFNVHALAFFPNPATSFISISMPCDTAWYTISDISGRTLLRGSLTRSLAVIPVQSLTAGCYLVQITNPKTAQTWTGKLFRQ